MCVCFLASWRSEYGFKWMFDVNDNFTKWILISMGFCSHTTHYCVALHTVRHPTESLRWLPVIYEQNGIHFKFNWYFDNQKECVGPTGSRSRWYRHHTTMSFHENVSVNSFYFSPFFTLIKFTRRKKNTTNFVWRIICIVPCTTPVSPSLS